MTITVGSYINVPKGTTTWDAYPSWQAGDVKPARRDMAVQVRAIFTPLDSARARGRAWWIGLLPESDRVNPNKTPTNNSWYDKYDKFYTYQEVSEDPALYSRLENLLHSKVSSGDLTLVVWGDRCTLLSFVTEGVEPQRKAAAPSVKQLMVKGSRWRLTQDVTFKWNAYGANYQTEERTANTISAGTEFEVTGKMRTSYPDNGLQVPIKRTFSDGSVREVWWFYNQISKIVEQIGTMQISQYAIKDTATGLYYGGDHHIQDQNGSRWETKWSSKFTQAKKYDSLAKLKTSLMGIGGYLHGLPGAEDIYYVYGTDNPGIEVPSTWQAVEFDKIAKQEIQLHDIQTWWTNLWRLRPLTMTFGSAVRSVMNEVEKRGQQDRFKGILMVGNPILESTDRWDLGTRYYDDEPLAPEAVKEADDAVKSVGLVKGSTIRVKSKQSVAWAFETPGQALMAKLAYGGKARMVVINLDTLQELTG